MGFLYTIFGQLLYYIYMVVRNYGISIIIFTVVVKLILLPLNIKSTESMREIQKLSGVMTYLQKKYRNNPEKLTQVQTELYKIYHVNPLGGCWPLLLQLPIIYGLFGALRNPAEYVFTHGAAEAAAASQPFLWIPSLANPDPYYILPILCVVLTFLTSKYTQSVNPQMDNEDSPGGSTNQMMMYIMPLMIGFFALSLPAGIAVYWVVQNIFTFLQQFLMLHKPVEQVSVDEAMAKIKEAEKEKRQEIKVARQMGTERRNEMMGNKPKNQKEKKKVNVKMTPVKSGTKKRKTITKIPERKE